MSEKPTRERSVGFTDASYIRQDDAPNTPRCYSFTEEKSSGTKKTPSPLRVAGLCLMFFVLGSLLTSALSDAEQPAVNTKTSIPSATPEAAFAIEDISGSAAISAAVNADTPPAEVSGESARPYLGVIVQTVSCAAAEYYNDTDSSAMVPGVQVYAVDDGGPAYRAGLCSGDIIIRLDDTDIATAADLTEAEDALSPGANAVLTVYRNGAYHEVPVVFSTPPEDEENDTGWCNFDNAW